MISIFLPIKKKSKRLKNKNFLKITKFSNGLSEIKILQLLKFSRLLKKKKISSEIVISTDSEKLLNKYANDKNVKIFRRQKSLTRDDCLEDLIKEVPKICFGKYILWTHTTSPVFNSKDYLYFVNFFLKQKKFKSACSATTNSTFFMDANFNWLSHNYKKNKWPRTQDLKQFYFVNNAAFISKRENYLKSCDRLDSKPLPIISRKYSDIDIDNKEDFVFFKRIFKNKSIPI